VGTCFDAAPYISSADRAVRTGRGAPDSASQRRCGGRESPGLTAAVHSEAATEAHRPADGLKPVWQALLDLRVWRTRPWWLRVAASLVVRRRNDLRR
jgi:hypothetical protein